MELTETRTPHIQICSLEAVREADVTAYDGVITIEDSSIQEPFRVTGAAPSQLVLKFDDISSPIDDFIMPQERHIRAGLEFARQWEQPSLLIHCKAGMSRSPAMALAILADWLGEGYEEEAVRELIKVSRLCTPNKHMIELMDQVLDRSRNLEEACKSLDITLRR